MTDAGTILVVDDDSIYLQIIGYTLESSGFTVVTAENGQIALDILKAAPQKFDAIVIDRIMPVLDGLSLLKLLHNNTDLRQIPVVMQTSESEPHSIKEGIEAGAYYYITKPYEQEILLAIIRSAVNTRQQNRLMFSYFTPLDSASFMQDATFHLRSIDEGRSVCWLISQTADDSTEVMMGLMELVANAIEHGNLGIGGDVKRNLILENNWENEFARLLALPENAEKIVSISFKRMDDRAAVTIKDCGEGFDWSVYDSGTVDLINKINGRGIALARSLAFDSVEYADNGSLVIATFGAS